tara:strand:+ start:7090 stop:8445 length:1356 start_codon:yes stop_codon:yes gene_type:complete
MAVNFSIISQPHGKFVSCQRPIVIRVRTTNSGGNTVAHYKGSLLLEDVPGSGNFIDTLVEMNGYTDDGGDIFSFNVSEYCSNYFEDEESFYNQNWCANFDKMLWRKFVLKINAVIETNDGSLEDDSTEKDTNFFIVTATNTMVDEATDTSGSYIKMDRFVANYSNNSASPWFNSSEALLMTNQTRNQVIDIQQGFYFFYPLLYSYINTRQAFLEIRNGAGVIEEIPANYIIDQHIAFHVHPLVLSFWLFLVGSPNQNMLLNNNGTLATNEMRIRFNFKSIATGNVIRRSLPMYYKLTDGFDKCQHTTFIFKNMRGAFDFFTATGTISKETDVSGVEFDRHTNFDRSDSQTFGVLRGQHSRTSLLNKRKQVFTVFSQPVTTEDANWLEELIVSPLTWITTTINQTSETKTGSGGLVAINIIKSSYKLHTTENGRHFIEFKYTLSENTLVQKN